MDASYDQTNVTCFVPNTWKRTVEHIILEQMLEWNHISKNSKDIFVKIRLKIGEEPIFKSCCLELQPFKVL